MMNEWLNFLFQKLDLCPESADMTSITPGFEGKGIHILCQVIMSLLTFSFCMAEYKLASTAGISVPEDKD